MKGGLGNQLFQYAAGRALSIRQVKSSESEVILKIDINGYGENNGIDTMRHYSLSPFNIRANIATNSEIRKLKYPFGIFSKGMRFIKNNIFHQYHLGFSKTIYEYSRNIYLDGFFQSEKYFLDNETIIRDDLKLIKPLGVEAKKILEQIHLHSQAVSVHVRRGDYVNDANTNQFHGTCSKDYYRDAVDHITSQIGKDINLYIFSDDIDWVRRNIRFDYPTTYVSSIDIKDYEELYLMSQCDHHIIANSSFSWWGAWLDERSSKIIVAPKQWLRNKTSAELGILPRSWITL